MNLIKSSVEIWHQNDGFEHIEKCARLCYKSEGNTQYDNKGNSITAKPFVDNIVNVKHHLSVTEHYTIYLTIPIMSGAWRFYMTNRFSKCNKLHNNIYVTTNYRVLLENNLLNDLIYQVDKTQYHEDRVTFHIICDRGILCELTRHRAFSFSVESSRFCNYSKDKFNNSCTFIIPNWCDIPEGEVNLYDIENFTIIHNNQQYDIDDIDYTFLALLKNAEDTYFALLDCGWKPEQARNVLPNALKTELAMTGFVSDWEQFLKLRTAPNAHPQMREIADSIKADLIQFNYIH